MTVAGKITLFTRLGKDNKTQSFSTYLSVKDAQGKEYREYIPCLITKNSNHKLAELPVGFVYHVDLANDASNFLTIAEKNGKTKQVIFLGNFNIDKQYKCK